ncbi:Phosphate regulon transcriptional regulatory protein PhoB (SphR) [Minicystis rosea]|nr:Phosphate regulon transcriptional regulatory protein PhoB (SphR) [Minicystis rosea]
MEESPESAATILVVDDNEQNRALVEATLEAEGHASILVSSGEAALAVFERQPVDCVLLDVRMPGLDGFAVCERIRALPGGKDVPIVFLTALRDVETFDRALLAGADDFLTKPVRPTELSVRVHAALKLRRLSADLRDHYELIRRQRDDLTRLALQKERLSAFVVHDLKNPLGSIDLLAQALVRDRRLPEDARDTALDIRGAARQLMRLIHNLLDISKSEEGKLAARRVEIDLPALVEEVRETFDIQARAAGVTLETLVEAPTLVADPDLIRRVLENLTENAIRHAPKGSAVRIAAAREDRGTALRVIDRGPGVPAELREKIFERFVQLEDAEVPVSRSGRGLGLAFCRLAVEAHGGRVWVEDAAPGAQIHVSLPDDA